MKLGNVILVYSCRWTRFILAWNLTVSSERLGTIQTWRLSSTHCETLHLTEPRERHAHHYIIPKSRCLGAKGSWQKQKPLAMAMTTSERGWHHSVEKRWLAMAAKRCIKCWHVLTDQPNINQNGEFMINLSSNPAPDISKPKDWNNSHEGFSYIHTERKASKGTNIAKAPAQYLSGWKPLEPTKGQRCWTTRACKYRHMYVIYCDYVHMRMSVRMYAHMYKMYLRMYAKTYVLTYVPFMLCMCRCVYDRM